MYNSHNEKDVCGTDEMSLKPHLSPCCTWFLFARGGQLISHDDGRLIGLMCCKLWEWIIHGFDYFVVAVVWGSRLMMWFAYFDWTLNGGGEFIPNNDHQLAKTDVVVVAWTEWEVKWGQWSLVTVCMIYCIPISRTKVESIILIQFNSSFCLLQTPSIIRDRPWTSLFHSEPLSHLKILLRHLIWYDLVKTYLSLFHAKQQVSHSIPKTGQTFSGITSLLMRYGKERTENPK